MNQLDETIDGKDFLNSSEEESEVKMMITLAALGVI